MFVHKPDFIEPKPSQTLWRYMDLAKFISLLQTGALYFCRADILKLSDPYEGSLTQSEQCYRAAYNKVTTEFLQSKGVPFITEEFFNHMVQEMHDKISLESFINCWHINDDESLAMWKVFSMDFSGIAIKTTFDRLIRSFQGTTENITAGVVRYSKFHEEDKDAKSTLSQSVLMRKNVYYEYEKELRLLYQEDIQETEDFILKGDNGQAIPSFRFKRPSKTGVHIKVTLDTLINEIYVDPKAPKWFEQTVQGLLDVYYRKVGLRNVPKVIKSMILDNKIESQSVDFGRLDAEYVGKVLKDVIENSSWGESARTAQYRIHYDEHGEILGIYPTNIEYRTIPEPFILIDYDEWQKLINNQGKYKVDVATKKLIAKEGSGGISE